MGRAPTLPWGLGVNAGYDVVLAGDNLECSVAEGGLDELCGVYQPVAANVLTGAAILLGVLAVVAAKTRMAPGRMFAVWMAWYGLQRFTLDFLRVGGASVGPISWNQLGGLTSGLAGFVLFLTLGRFRSTDENPVGSGQPAPVKT